MLDDTRNLLEAEFGGRPAGEANHSGVFELDGPFDEATEMALATEFLNLQDRGELDRFIRRALQRSATGALPSPLRSSLARAIRGVARRALPPGSTLPRQRERPEAGARTVAAAGRLFGLELEGLSPEDQEFEVARRFVRFVGATAAAASAARPQVPPRRVVRRALGQALREHVPGLLRARHRAPPTLAPPPAPPSSPTPRRGSTMHDLDRTQLESDYDDEFEFEDEYGDGPEGEYEFDDAEYEFESDYDDEFEFEGAVLDPNTELELAAELLTVQDDQEMEQFLGALVSTVAPMALKALPHIARGARKLFGGGRRRRRRRPAPRSRSCRELEFEFEFEDEYFLGNLVRRASRGARRFLRSRTGRTLVSGLRSTARKVFPMAGGDAGGYIGRQVGMGRAGRQIGRRYGRRALRQLGLEMEFEGLDPQDQEFEAARQFVRFAADASKKTMLAPASAPPKAVVKKSIEKAARKHAPGLAKTSGRAATSGGAAIGGQRTGQWRRRGRRIVLYGV